MVATKTTLQIVEKEIRMIDKGLNIKFREWDSKEWVSLDDYNKLLKELNRFKKRMLFVYDNEKLLRNL